MTSKIAKRLKTTNDITNVSIWITTKSDFACLDLDCGSLLRYLFVVFPRACTTFVTKTTLCERI